MRDPAIAELADPRHRTQPPLESLWQPARVVFAQVPKTTSARLEDAPACRGRPQYAERPAAADLAGDHQERRQLGVKDDSAIGKAVWSPWT